MAQQINSLPDDPNLHIVVYWSLNEIVKQRKPQSSRETAAIGSEFVVAEPDDNVHNGFQELFDALIASSNYSCGS